MSSTETWTIGRLLTWTTDYLKQHGSDSPRLDAEVLLAESRGCKRIELYTAFDEVASEQTRTTFRELVRRRAEGAPVAYLVGHREFFSMPFRVGPEVLIPRPETELLVTRVLDLLKENAAELAEPQVVDVGTGSGIIAICIAKQFPAAKLTAVDASTEALAIARHNAEQLKVAERIEFFESDLLSAAPLERTFQIVASNPPYVSEAEFDKLSPGVRNFEPRMALVAGPKGTEVIERLVPQAAERLADGGWLVMEVSPMIEPLVRELIAARGDFQLHPTLKDLAGHPRVVQAKKIGDASP